MNMQKLMQQAQKMQKEIAEKKEEIDNTIFSAEASLVKVEYNGKKEMVSINIKKDVSYDNDDVEALEDMIMVASRECLQKIDDMTNEKLGAYASAMNGLM